MSPASDGWLEHDHVPPSRLPEPARSAAQPTPAVRFTEVGLVVSHGAGLASLVRWSDVLGVAVLPASERFLPQAYLLVPRSPPHAPWFAVGVGMLPPELRNAGIAGFADHVRQRVSPWGYRSALTDRARLPPDEVLARVLARQPLPGAVEVPVGPPPDPTHGGWQRALGVVGVASGGAFVTGYFGLIVSSVLAAALTNPLALLLAVPAAAAGGAVGFGVAVRQTTRDEGRVLVMTPDACVVGFYEGVRALGWDSIAAFRTGALFRQDLGRSSPALEVVGRAGDVIGRVEAHWFSVPLDLVVAVAAAYRGQVTTLAEAPADRLEG